MTAPLSTADLDALVARNWILTYREMTDLVDSCRTYLRERDQALERVRQIADSLDEAKGAEYSEGCMRADLLAAETERDHARRELRIIRDTFRATSKRELADERDRLRTLVVRLVEALQRFDRESPRIEPLTPEIRAVLREAEEVVGK